MVALTHIKLPERYTTDLPNAIHVKTDFATIDKTYRVEDGEIIVERSVTVLKKKVTKEDWKSYQKFVKDARLETEPWIQLIPPEKPMTVTVEKNDTAPKPSTVVGKNGPIIVSHLPVTAPATTEPKPVDENASATELVDKGREQLRSGDWSSAKATLEAAKKKNANEQYVYALLGMIAVQQRNWDEAKADYEVELKNHPANPGAVIALANVEKRSGDASAAKKTLKDYLVRYPDERSLSMSLASMQLAEEDYNGALATLQAASDRHPEDAYVHVQLATTLVRLNRPDEAAAAAKSVLEDTQDPEIMNDAAYVLSETNRDLVYAETMSRKSIALLEEKTASITTAEANRQAFATTNLLIVSWDTLGWILYQEGKHDEAQALVAAAWRASLNPEVGDHLGQIYEAMKKKDEACAAYRLADAAANSNTGPEIRRHIHDGFTRLEAAGAKPGPKNGAEELQNLRTYKLGHVADASGWGTFRLEVAAEGVIEAQQMTGEHRVAPVTESIKRMKLPELLPPGSKAHLLRSAVASCSQSSGVRTGAGAGWRPADRVAVKCGRR